MVNCMMFRVKWVLYFIAINVPIVSEEYCVYCANLCATPTHFPSTLYINQSVTFKYRRLERYFCKSSWLFKGRVNDREK